MIVMSKFFYTEGERHEPFNLYFASPAGVCEAATQGCAFCFTTR